MSSEKAIQCSRPTTLSTAAYAWRPVFCSTSSVRTERILWRIKRREGSAREFSRRHTELLRIQEDSRTEWDGSSSPQQIDSGREGDTSSSRQRKETALRLLNRETATGDREPSPFRCIRKKRMTASGDVAEEENMDMKITTANGGSKTSCHPVQILLMRIKKNML